MVPHHTESKVSNAKLRPCRSTMSVLSVWGNSDRSPAVSSFGNYPPYPDVSWTKVRTKQPVIRGMHCFGNALLRPASVGQQPTPSRRTLQHQKARCKARLRPCNDSTVRSSPVRQHAPSSASVEQEPDHSWEPGADRTTAVATCRPLRLTHAKLRSRTVRLLTSLHGR